MVQLLFSPYGQVIERKEVMPLSAYKTFPILRKRVWVVYPYGSSIPSSPYNRLLEGISALNFHIIELVPLLHKLRMLFKLIS